MKQPKIDYDWHEYIIVTVGIVYAALHWLVSGSWEISIMLLWWPICFAYAVDELREWQNDYFELLDSMGGLRELKDERETTH